MPQPSLECSMTWAEDRALLKSNPSADPGAEDGAGRSSRFALLLSPLRFWHQGAKLSRQDAATSSARCALSVTNGRCTRFQFTVNQYKWSL